MPQKVVNQARGLKTFKNELMQPDGSQIVANNVVIDRDNTIEPRRGFDLYGATFGNTSYRAKQILEYKSRLLVHYSNKLSFDDGSGTFTDFSGTYSELEAGLRIKGLERNGNFYFTTADGVKKISATSASSFTNSANYIYDSGAAKGLDGYGEPTANIGYLTDKSVVAYRIVWGYSDSNDNLVLGTPSARIEVRNLSTTSTTVNLYSTIPEEVSGDSKYFYQVYRSAMVDDSVSPGSATPSDELQLIIEDFPTNTDFSNGYITLEDITPDDFREGGAYLYTNPVSGEGILQSNEKPPLCKDLAEYRNSIFYANTKTRHQKQLAIISTSLLANDNTIIIGDVNGEVTYTFKASENVASKQVLLATGGTVSQNIDDTARSLVKVINRDSACPVYAYYISGVDDVPGLILFESRVLSDVSFYVKRGVSTNPAAFNPKLPSTNTEVSTNTTSPNRLYYSKVSQPEAVPAINYIDVGAKDSPIVRIAALRNSLLIFKTDGIYRVSGTDTTNFTLNLEDSSAIITAADSLAILNNEIYLVTTQGIVVVSEASGNPRVISRDIEDLIFKPKTYAAFSKATFGLSYESDRCYMIFMPSISSDTTATQAYRYNVFTQTWVKWAMSKTCGIVAKSDDKLYLGAADLNQLEQERKNFDRTDYSDRSYDNTIPAVAVKEKNINVGSLQNVKIFDVLYQEMYITISRFNRLLIKLDRDILLTDSDYYSSLKQVAGASMNNALSDLVAKIAADDTLGTYSTPSGSNNFTTIKNEFNTLIDELNSSSGVFYGNYKKYTDTVVFESVIQSITSNRTLVTVLDALPFIQGEIKIYSSIPCEIEWTPESVGDVSLLKQFRDATLMFDQFNFSNGTFSFRSDLSDNYEDSTFFGEGTGCFGCDIYGETTYGGNSNQIPHRTLVPRNKQRCRFINLRFLHDAAREKFVVTGYSVTYNGGASEKAYTK